MRRENNILKKGLILIMVIMLFIPTLVYANEDMYEKELAIDNIENTVPEDINLEVSDNLLVDYDNDIGESTKDSSDQELTHASDIDEMNENDSFETEHSGTDLDAEKTNWTNLVKKTVKGSSNFKDAWNKTTKPSYSTVNYGYSSTAGIRTYYTDTWSRYKHRSITKCCNSAETVKKSKTSATQSAYHWIVADIFTTTKYTYVIYQAQRTGKLQ